MKTLDNLKAFSLEKKQMNAVKGGETRCTVDFGDGGRVSVTTEEYSPDEAEKFLKRSYGDSAEVTCA